MKLAVLLEGLPKGGVVKLAAMELREFLRKGYDATLLVLHKNENETTYSDILEGLPVRYLSDEIPGPFRWGRTVPLFSFFTFALITSMFWLPYKLKEREYDLLLVHATYTCFSAIAAKWFRNIPYIAYIHDSIYFIIQKAYISPANTFKKALYTPFKYVGYLLDKLLFSQALAVAKQTSFELDYIRRQGAKKAISIPPSTANRQPSMKITTGDYFLVFSKWDFSKNLDFIIDILLELKDLKVVIAGLWHPPEYQLKITKRLKQKGLHDRVKITGPIAEDEIPSLFRGAVALIHPLFESWGSTIYEAACNSTTFIAVEKTCIQDYLKDGVDGFFLPQNDLKAYCEKISLLKENKELALKMGQIAWKNIEKINIQSHVDKLLELGEIKKF